MKNKKIDVIVVSRDFLSDKPILEHRTIKNTLEEFQSIVGGFIEVVRLSPSLVIVCNEEGKLKDLPVVAYLSDNYAVVDTLNGDFILCSDDGQCEFCSLKAEPRNYSFVLDKSLKVYPVFCIEYPAR